MCLKYSRKRKTKWTQKNGVMINSKTRFYYLNQRERKKKDFKEGFQKANERKASFLKAKTGSQSWHVF